MIRATVIVAFVSAGFVPPPAPCSAQTPSGAEVPSDQQVKLIKAPAGFEKTYEMKVADFDEFTIKDDRFTLNNVILKESNDGRRGQATIRFTASVRNKTKGYENVNITLIGLDDKKAPVWASKASNGVDANWVGIIQDYDTPVTKGTLKSTHMVWVKVSVSFTADDED